MQPLSTAVPEPVEGSIFNSQFNKQELPIPREHRIFLSNTTEFLTFNFSLLILCQPCRPHCCTSDYYPGLTAWAEICQPFGPQWAISPVIPTRSEESVELLYTIPTSSHETHTKGFVRERRNDETVICSLVEGRYPWLNGYHRPFFDIGLLIFCRLLILLAS